jgi:hydrogenase nickel incorporation protein HypA/HybF
MHELAITESIVDHVVSCVGASRVRRVVIEIGRLSAVVPDAVAFAFDVCTQGTTLEGATLEIRNVQGEGVCRRCGMALDMGDLFALCACGSSDIQVTRGEELRVREVEVEEG